MRSRGRDRGKHRGAALCLHHLPVPRSPAFGHRRRGAEPARTMSPPSTWPRRSARHLGADRGARRAAAETLGRWRPRSAMPRPRALSRCRAAMVRPPCWSAPASRWRKLLGKASRTADFVDHFRSVDNQFDYQWEERWIRDAGYMPIVPPAIKRCLEAAKAAAKDVTHFCMPATLSRVANADRQGGRHRRQGDLRSPARRSGRHGRGAPADAAGRRCWRRPSRREDPAGRLRTGRGCAACSR